MKELPDNHMIHEDYPKNPRPFWTGLLFVGVLFFVIFSIQWGVKEWLEEKLEAVPFNRVTNREFSVFLWQNPEFMRINAKSKRGYLPDFQYIDGVSVEPELADRLVVAPPEVLFAYHTWKRLLGVVWIPTPITPTEFKKFLQEDPEWQLTYWKRAPKSYVQLLNTLDDRSRDISSDLPLEVRLAVQGWKNSTYFGQEIKEMNPTYGQVRFFIERYPMYRRSLWKNLIDGPYLVDLSTGKGDERIPQNQLSGFLKAALFEAHQSHS